jgi:calcium binding protein 39
MASFFGLGRNKQKSPAELAHETKDLTLRLTAEEKPNPKVDNLQSWLVQHHRWHGADWRCTCSGPTTDEDSTSGYAWYCSHFIDFSARPANADMRPGSYQNSNADRIQDTEVSPESVLEQLGAIMNEDLLFILATNIHRLPFESRKDAQVIFSTAFRYKRPGQSDPEVLHHIVTFRPEIIIALCRGYDRRESAMPCGGVLREALKYDAICALLLYDEPTEDGHALDLGNVNPDLPSSGNGVLWNFFDWIDKGAFEVSADAFNTFRVPSSLERHGDWADSTQEILTKHKTLVATYLQTNFDMFFAKYNSMLIQSESYVTKRQSIKLLGEILLDRANYNVMTQYVDSGDHLKIIMRLLRDDRKMINYEGFHVFKV